MKNSAVSLETDFRIPLLLNHTVRHLYVINSADLCTAVIQLSLLRFCGHRAVEQAGQEGASGGHQGPGFSSKQVY